ncbi:restriction endonuclease subunit S [Aliikangiella maris]|uniref:Restriction endonuclease subunit S n=2 Tax=Aliikangiella maris TaxID=3162458 RepID=A0ABV3MSH5_9GAMM
MSEIHLPESWLETKLESLTTDISYGYTASSSSDLIGPKMLRITDIQDNKVNWNDVPYCYIDSDKKDKYILYKNDLVFARTGATVGKSFLIRNTPPEAVYASYLIRVRTTSDGMISFLAHFFNSNQYWKQITEFSSGIGQPNVNGTKLKALDVPVPPLAEQKVIAERLDKLLAQVENTKARLERIPEILKRFRQSVLAAAVSGKLTEEWRRKNMQTWPDEEKKLGDVIELAYGKSLPSKSRSGSGFPVFGSNGEVGIHKEKLVSGPFIIVGRKGSYGEVTWSNQSGWPIDTTYYVIPKTEANLRFVYFLLQTLGLNQLNRSTAIPGLNREDAYGCSVTFPAINEQSEIVRRVEELLAFANLIEERLNDTIDRVTVLTQVILAKAFCGELTAEWREENQELITGENSAEALLEKIRLERDIRKKLMPKRKSKKAPGNKMKKEVISVVEALKDTNKSMSGQELMSACGYPSDSDTEKLEQFFLDIRTSLLEEKSIIKLERTDDGQDWFELAETEIVKES